MTGQPYRVVAVDDETGHRQHLLGLRSPVFVVEHAYASVEELLADRPDADVVLLDLWLRVGQRPLRGLAAVEELVALGHRVLLHSMDERPYVLARLIAAGAQGFVSKAATDEELAVAVERVARGEMHVLTTQVAGFADHLRHLGLLRLTEAETAVLRARAQGIPVKTIALTSHYSEKALERHVTHINRKIKAFLQHVEIEGLTAGADRPSAYLAARYLGLGPDDLL